MRSGEWSIQQVASAAGTTSRTLRHYGALGLLPPSRIGANGYRYYNQDSLIRLQRILLLRELGVGLSVIAEILAGEQDTTAALRTHLELLRQQQAQLQRRIDAVSRTLHKTERGEPLMAAEVFDGFDHEKYKDEVIERWGEKAYTDSNNWWRSLTETDKVGFQQAWVDIVADYRQAYTAGLGVDSPEVTDIVDRHRAWVGQGWGDKPVSPQALVCLGDMYVADSRFHRNFDQEGSQVTEYVRDAIHAFAERESPGGTD